MIAETDFAMLLQQLSAHALTSFANGLASVTEPTPTALAVLGLVSAEQHRRAVPANGPRSGRVVAVPTWEDQPDDECERSDEP